MIKFRNNIEFRHNCLKRADGAEDRALNALIQRAYLFHDPYLLVKSTIKFTVDARTSKAKQTKVDIKR